MFGPPLLELTSHIAYIKLADILLWQSEKSKHAAFYRLKFKVEYSVSRWEQIGKSLYSPQGSAVSKYQKLVFEELQSEEKWRLYFIVDVLSRQELIEINGVRIREYILKQCFSLVWIHFETMFQPSVDTF